MKVRRLSLLALVAALGLGLVACKAETETEAPAAEGTGAASEQDSGPTQDSPKDPGAPAAWEGPDPIKDRAAEDAPTWVYWGDNHVHTRFSPDAFAALMLAGELKYPRDVFDACQYARHCVDLDFFVSSDHAEFQSKDNWDNIREQVRECQADVRPGEEFVAYVGFEWTQAPNVPGDAVAKRYGHKIVHFEGIEDEETTPRPIGASDVSVFQDRCDPDGTCGDDSFYGSSFGRAVTESEGEEGEPRVYPASEFVELLSLDACASDVPDADSDCLAVAHRPEDLFRKLDKWRKGAEGVLRKVVVGAHGTAWGLGGFAEFLRDYTQADYWPEYERYFEVFSKHGSSEEHVEKAPDYVVWENNVATSRACDPTEGDESCLCNERRGNYVPCCRRCYELIDEHCDAVRLGALACKRAKEKALGPDGALACNAMEIFGGDEGVIDWLDCGQCPSCSFAPAAGYAPQGSVQAALATPLSSTALYEDRPYYEMAFLGATDTHHARPGSVHEEREFAEIPEGLLDGLITAARNPVIQSYSFWYTGGVTGVHVPTGNEDPLREAIFDAFVRREIFATSGPRIKLWFDLKEDETTRHPMGSVLKGFGAAPTFEVRAVGAPVDREDCELTAMAGYVEDPPTFAEETCRGWCYVPHEQKRHPIVRLEVVRIRRNPLPDGEVASLVEDPWQSFDCEAEDGSLGLDDCKTTFTDPEYPQLTEDVVYYARALQEESEQVNVDPLRCTRDESGTCLESKPCPGERGSEDECKSAANERAWSSPVYLYHP